MTAATVRSRRGIDAIMLSLGRLGDDLKTKGLRSAVIAYSNPIKKQIRGRINSRTGSLKRSIGHVGLRTREKVTLGYKSDSVVIAVGSTRKVPMPGKLVGVSHASKLIWLDAGTERHEIGKGFRLKRRGFGRLVQKLKIGTGFASTVTHPGVKARHILAKSVASSRSESIQRFDRKLEQFLDKHK